MLTGHVILTEKGKQAIEDYKAGAYSAANISELQFMLLLYIQQKQRDGLDVSDSLRKYGTKGTAALEELIDEGKIKRKGGPAFMGYSGDYDSR